MKIPSPFALIILLFMFKVTDAQTPTYIGESIPQSVGVVLYPDQFPGDDLGAQIIRALASSTSTYNTIHVRGKNSPYTWSTPVTIDPRYTSIVGEGSGTTKISCTAVICLNLHEGTVLSISQTSLSSSGMGTYSYVTVSGRNPHTGQTVTINGTANAGGALNVTNLPIAKSSGSNVGTFTIAGLPTGTMYANQTEAGSGTTEPFSIDPGGMVGGFSMTGSGLAGQIGIQSSGVQNERWDDITFSGFTGRGSISWNLFNSDTTNGWQERIQATKIRVTAGGGLKFSYNSKNVLAQSFGYSEIHLTCDDAGTTPCLQVASGRLYGSRIIVQGNIEAGGVLVEALGDMDLNDYFISAEPLNPKMPGTCIHVSTTGEMEGTGSVVCNGSAITNDNANSFSARLRIGPVDTNKGAAILGTMTNFLGTGFTASAQMVGVNDDENPYAGFGTIHGPFVDSTYTSMQNVGTNAHVFYACPFAYSDLNSCAIVGEVTNAGVGKFRYNGYFPFSTDPINLPAAYCWWNGTEQRLKCSDGTQARTVAWNTNLPLTGTTTALPSTAISAGTCRGITASVPGATSGMAVVATPASYTPLDLGLHWDTAFVSSPGIVSVPICNQTAKSITPSSTPAFNVRVFQ